jgi:hypothetical protein
MGLTIVVGGLAEMAELNEEGAAWLRGEIEKLNRVLAAHGVPAHREPEAAPLLESDGFSYEFLHFLRRAYACLLSGKPLRTGKFKKADETLIDELTSEEHHLLFHSDAEGFYVPQDFAHAIHDEDLPGALVGSSQRLLAELDKLAPFLGISGTDVLGEPDESDPLWIEKLVWQTLHAAARHSVAHGALIVFA